MLIADNFNSVAAKIYIMDPTGVFIVYDYFLHFIHEDTDMRAGEVGNLLYWPGLDPGISVL